MELLIQLTILLAIFHKSSSTRGEEAVTIKSDKMPWRIGDNITLTCVIKEKTDIVKWMKDDNGISNFIDNKCYLNPEFKGKYNCPSDPNENKFQLIILGVTKDDNGQKLVCTDGFLNKCTYLYVGEEEQKFEETENGTVTFTSACSQEENISIQWFKINVITNKVERFKPKVLNKTRPTCSNKCSGNSKKYEEKISIVPNGNGTKYYLITNVTYGNESIVSKQTSDGYEVEEDGPINAKNEKLDVTQTVVGFLGVVGIVGVVVVVVGGGGVGVAFYINKRKPHMEIFEFCRRSDNSNKKGGKKEKADAGDEYAREEQEVLIVDEHAREEEEVLIVDEHAREEEEVLIIKEKFIKTVDDDDKEGSNDGTPSVIPDIGQSSLPLPNIGDQFILLG